ncbi:MAG: SAM-dependent methyltransferase [Bacteroidales bacterium]|nr:SAM-dependent methyltransferase [Bacteroidales bacterium]MBN2757895.1 SAM-dependent methyltransferase [Bacteroidales bacterium]
MKKGKIFLIPTTLGDSELDRVLPGFNLDLINNIKYYIVENVRTARRFLVKSEIKTKIDDLQFFELNKHTDIEEYSTFLKPALSGFDIGIISEAGCPGVADPGADIVKIAHEIDIDVIPLVGPSSILLALMASGMNGQNFAFKGYLPVDNIKKLKQLKNDELRSRKEAQTQIYIETPYRNMQLLKFMIDNLAPTTKLCVAADITLETEYIKTKSIEEWSKKTPDFNKRPTIFLVYA